MVNSNNFFLICIFIAFALANSSLSADNSLTGSTNGSRKIVTIAQLRSAIQSFKAKRMIYTVYGNQKRLSEIWDFTYQSPSEALMIISDSNGNRIGRSVWIGNKFSTSYNSYNYTFDRSADEPFDRLADFVGIRNGSNSVKEEYSIAPGLSIPSSWTIEIPSIIEQPGIAQPYYFENDLVDIQINSNVGGYFASQGN